MNNTPRVETYTLIAMTGKKVGRYPKVIFPDGTEIKFIDRMSNREAIKQATYHYAKRRVTP